MSTAVHLSSPLALPQDGHQEIWEQEYVAGIIAAEVDRRDISTVRPILAFASSSVQPANQSKSAVAPLEHTHILL